MSQPVDIPGRAPFAARPLSAIVIRASDTLRPPQGASAPFDAGRVARLRAAVAGGRQVIDPQAIADGFLKVEGLLSSGQRQPGASRRLKSVGRR